MLRSHIRRALLGSVTLSGVGDPVRFTGNIAGS